MLVVLTRLVQGYARRVVAVAVAVTLIAAVAGAFGISRLKAGGFDDPASESYRATAVLRDTFAVQQPNLQVLVAARTGSVLDPVVAGEGRSIVAQLAAQPGVTVLAEPWGGAAPAVGTVSTDGRTGQVVAFVAGTPEQTRTLATTLGGRLETGPDVVVTVGGYARIDADINSQITSDLASAESVAVPLTLILLVVVFASVVAALMPMLVGVFAVFGTFAVLALLTLGTDVSVFALNLTTALGLGLAVDYALLVVSRYREELGRGLEPAAALARTMATAGRTILFSSATVAVALAALLVFPQFFLRSFAYAGIAVVGVAATGALVVLPAVLTLLGGRIEKLRIGAPKPAGLTRADLAWGRLARYVIARPLRTAVPVIALLVLMAVPVAGLKVNVGGDRALPTSSAGRQVADVLRSTFPTDSATALTVVLSATTATDTELQTYRAALAAVPDVTGVGLTRVPAGAFLTVQPDGGEAAAAGARGRAVLDAVRAVPAPSDRLVTGEAAVLADSTGSVVRHAPLALALIAISTLVLLFLFTGSVVMPVKALLLNLLGLSAMFGVITWVFVDGHGAGLLGVTPSPIAVGMPPLMFCVAFGLSMDYEVFLLARIVEARHQGASNGEAVARGLERTGRIVSLAAVLLSITFFAFLTSKISFIQLFGLGSGLAIVLDATLIRGILVPAFLRVAGEASWWSPAPLRRLHARIGLSEASDDAEPAFVPV